MTAITLRLDQTIINQLRASLIRQARIYWIFYRDPEVWCDENSGGRKTVKKKLGTGKLWIFLSWMLSKKMFITQIALGYTPSSEHWNFFWKIVCWKPIGGDSRPLGEFRKKNFEIFGWAVFEIWTMWYLDRVLGGPEEFFRENIKYIKSNLNVSPFSYSFCYGA